MRRRIATLVACGLAVVLVTPTAAPANKPGPAAADAKAMRAGLQLADKAKTTAKAPTGANPYLALLPDPSTADYTGWRKHLTAKNAQRLKRQAQQRVAAAATPLLVDEDEPAGTRGSNDSTATAQQVDGFGTRRGENPRARILGALSPEVVSPTAVAPNTEDDGAIPLARDTGITTARDGITTTGTIGDGPHGSAAGGTGDFDFYKVTAAVNDSLTVDMDTPTGNLDTVVVLYDAAGTVLALNDDSGGSLDSLLNFRFTVAGTYYVLVTGFAVLPEDPTDPASGTGAQSEGPYNVSIVVGATDADFFAVRLRKGDVLGTSVKGASTNIILFDPAGREVHGSTQDATFIYPENTPLPGGGNAVAEHVAKSNGWHFIAVTDGNGGYDITAEVFRPGNEGNPPVQTLFLDFDGARLNTGIFGGPGVRTLSPLRAFLGKWGLTRADENALINGIIAEVRESIRQDMINSGLNGRFRIRILNSRDHGEQWGKPNVSRVIVGGTIAESGIPTIGIAQSIDPGNFDTEESALVLLDVLSDAAGPAGDPSLNTYLTPASNRIGFVAQAVGNVTAHEAGHFFGNWHTDQFNAQANLQDQGGNFPLLYGVGPDGVGGTADDPDVDFGEDTFNPNEGFTGTEDTLARIATVLTR